MLITTKTRRDGRLQVWALQESHRWADTSEQAATCLEPIATLDKQTGDLVLNEEIVAEIKKLATKPTRT